jgi:hypothetical protein
VQHNGVPDGALPGTGLAKEQSGGTIDEGWPALRIMRIGKPPVSIMKNI